MTQVCLFRGGVVLQFSSLTSFLQLFLSDEFVVGKTQDYGGNKIIWQPNGHITNAGRQQAPSSAQQNNQPAAPAAEQQQVYEQQPQAQQRGIRHQQCPADKGPEHHVPSSGIAAAGATAASVDAAAEHNPSQAASVWDRLGAGAGAPVSPPPPPPPLPAAAAAVAAQPPPPPPATAAADKRVTPSVLTRVATHHPPTAGRAAAVPDVDRSVKNRVSDLPAIFKRLSAAAHVSKQPAKPSDTGHQVSLPPSIDSELADEMDLVVIQTLLQHMKQERRAAASGASQAQSLEEGEVTCEPELQLVDGTAAEDEQLIRDLPRHWMPATDFVDKLRQIRPLPREQAMAVGHWLHHLCETSVLHEREGKAAGSVANGAADVSVNLEVSKMVDRLLKHKVLADVLGSVEEALVAEMRVGSKYTEHVKVPRLEVEAANRVLRSKVPQLRPYLLVSQRTLPIMQISAP